MFVTRDKVQAAFWVARFCFRKCQSQPVAPSGELPPLAALFAGGAAQPAHFRGAALSAHGFGSVASAYGGAGFGPKSPHPFPRI